MAEITPSKSAGSSKKNTSKLPEGIEVRNPDAVQERIIDVWGWMEENIVFVSIVFGLLILAVAANAVVGWMGSRKEHSAQEAFYAVDAKFAKTKEGFDRAKLKAMMPQMAQQDKNADDKAATGDLAKDYGTLITDLEKVARDYAGTAAGAQAAILAADTYLSYNQPDKAAEIAQVPAKSMNEKNMLPNFAKLIWGSAVADKGDCKEAIKIWEQVLNNKAVPYLHGDASLRSGLCYEAMNDTQKAMEMYQKSSEKGGAESSTAATAKSLMRALELKNKAAAPAKQG